MQAMVRCYCRGHQKAGSALCGECLDLLSYAAQRLERCQFGEDKPTCARCPVHCYQRQWREQIKTVMRYAGTPHNLAAPGPEPAPLAGQLSQWPG